MRRASLRLASGMIALGLTVASLTHGQIAQPAAKATLSDQDKDTINSFLKAANAYLAIDRKAPSQAKLKSTNDVAQIDQRRRELRQIIVAARPNAKQGDLFTPPVAALFRRLIADAMDGSEGNKVRRSLQSAEPVAATEAPQIAVNHVYPNLKGQPLQSTPATLLQCLPALPKGLEYRLVGNILVLRDTEANLVVDYLVDGHK